MNVGEKIYYRTEHGGYNYGTLRGETSRSWIVGGAIWHQRKLPKKTTVLISKEEYEQTEWVRRHADAIARMVRFSDNYAVLKQIAELIGYKEQSGGGR